MTNSVQAVDRPSRLRAFIHAGLFLLANLLIVPLYVASVGPFRRFKRPCQVLWCRAMCAVAGLKVRTIGEKCRGGPILFVSNHTSYLDIPVISGAMDGCFIAKAEVAEWPLFGIISRVTRTVFIKRVGSQARSQRNDLLSRLLAGENLILFPEGTSTDGSAVAPFKSTLFGIAERLPPGLGLTIQPVSVAYTHDRFGNPLTGERRALFCWYGEATMAPHMWRVLGMRGCHVEVRFHPPLTVTDGANRKWLAAEAHARVAAGVAIANAGMSRLSAVRAPAPPLSAAARVAAGAARRSEPGGR